MNWKERGRKWSWLNLRYCLGIHLISLRKPLFGTIGVQADSNQAPLIFVLRFGHFTYSLGSSTHWMLLLFFLFFQSCYRLINMVGETDGKTLQKKYKII
jgi:hypothetical protein